MDFDKKCYNYEYYSSTGNSCLSANIYFKSFRATAEATATCPAPAEKMSAVDDPVEMLLMVWHILCTILPAKLWFTLARVIVQVLSRWIKIGSVLRFFIEFIVIAVPTVIGINVFNDSVEYIVVMMALLFAYIIWRTGCLRKAAERSFAIGTRPRMLTLGRATINILTAYCILAIDFETFPKHFRKTRRYGVGLMDTGIGLFVFAMGSVSKRPKRNRDLLSMFRIVVPLLLLGFIRTIVICAIEYHQDEHEYGRHLNAFFTLGLAKLFGTLFSIIARRDKHLLPLGLAVLAIHETMLQLYVADFVMDEAIDRVDFLTANREGLCSLPGFVGIYLVSMYLGHLYRTTESHLKFKEFLNKMKTMAIVCFAIWLLTICSIFTVSIARVTCNFGYAAWILGIASLMILLFMLVFDLVLNTLYPIDEKPHLAQLDGGEGAVLINTPNRANSSSYAKFAIPTLIEAVNMNGLVFFLIANVLTGLVNIFLKPEFRSSLEGYFILCIYMLLATGVVFVLYRRNIRIG